MHRVAMKINIRFGGYAADFFDGLDRAELVIRVHHAYQNCFWAQRAANFVGIDYASASDRNVGDFDSLLFKRLVGIENRVMFERRRDDVLPSRR